MYKIVTAILVIFLSFQANAQFIKEKSIDVSIGYGVSTPYEDVNLVDSGFYLQGEYVLVVSKWFDFRPYLGVIFTKSGGKDLDDNPSDFIATTNAALLGGKVRLTIPIPWVAPYAEVGIGASIGSFRTLTPLNDIDKSGVIFHIPFSFGLELGRKHNFDIGLTYYFQNNVEQFAGAAAFGVSFPLN